MLVLLGHAIQLSDPGIFTPGRSLLNHAQLMIYSFHMPLFMFLSGWLLFGRQARVGKTIKRLALPFLAWFVILFFLNRQAVGALPRQLWEACYKLDHLPLWFLWILLALTLLTMLLSRAAGRWKYGEEVSFLAAIVLVELLPWNNLLVYKMQWLIGFFFAGYLIAKHRKSLDRLKPELKSWGLATGAVVFAVTFFVLYSRLANILSPWTFRHMIADPGMFVPRLVLAPLGIIACFALMAGIRRLSDRTFSVFAWLGLFTMDLYVMHGALQIFSFGTGSQRILSGFLLPLLLALAVSLLVIRNSRALSYALLGRSYMNGPRYRLVMRPDPLLDTGRAVAGVYVTSREPVAAE